MILFFIISGKLKKLENFKNNLHSVFSNHKLNISVTNKQKTADIVTYNIINNKKAENIIIVGGDGTINECVNGIMRTDTSNHSKIKLGIIPTGTGNDLVKSLNLTNNLNKLLNYIENNSFTGIDICKMNYINHSKTEDSRYFINMADIGIGASVVKKINESSRKLFPSTIYFRAILWSFFTYKRRHIKFESPNFNWKGEILSLCIANGRYFGDGLCIAPKAKINNGKLAITILGKLSIIDYLIQMGKVKKCKPLNLKEVEYAEVNNCRITATNAKESPIDMDGEFIGYTPITVDVFPRYINVYGRYLSY